MSEQERMHANQTQYEQEDALRALRAEHARLQASKAYDELLDWHESNRFKGIEVETNQAIRTFSQQESFEKAIIEYLMSKVSAKYHISFKAISHKLTTAFGHKINQSTLRELVARRTLLESWLDNGLDKEPHAGQ